MEKDKKLSLSISAIAIALSVVSLYYSIKSNNFANELKIEPQIRFEYVGPFKGTSEFVLFFINDGVSTISEVKVYNTTRYFDHKKKKLLYTVYRNDGEPFMFVNSLLPNDTFFIGFDSLQLLEVESPLKKVPSKIGRKDKKGREIYSTNARPILSFTIEYRRAIDRQKYNAYKCLFGNLDLNSGRLVYIESNDSYPKLIEEYKKLDFEQYIE